jgi:hypothetical protein
VNGLGAMMARQRSQWRSGSHGKRNRCSLSLHETAKIVSILASQCLVEATLPELVATKAAPS